VTRLRAGGPRNLVSIPGKGKRFISSSQLSNRLWGPPSILSSEYRCVKLTLHIHLNIKVNVVP
jgi:hypothetical protein